MAEEKPARNATTTDAPVSTNRSGESQTGTNTATVTSGESSASPTSPTNQRATASITGSTSLTTTTTTTTTTTSTTFSNASSSPTSPTSTSSPPSPVSTSSVSTSPTTSPKAKAKKQPAGWRVKLYQLNNVTGSWDDKGTGFVQCKYLESVNGNAIQVISEDDSAAGSRVLLESQASNDDVYRRQGETIILWSEANGTTDLALSFQDPRGCREIYDQLLTVQGRVASDFHEELQATSEHHGVNAGAHGNTGKRGQAGRESIGNNTGNSGGWLGALHDDDDDMNGRDFDRMSQTSDRTQGHGNEIFKDLPVPKRENLEEIASILGTAVASNVQMLKEYYARIILSPLSAEELVDMRTSSSSSSSDTGGTEVRSKADEAQSEQEGSRKINGDEPAESATTSTALTSVSGNKTNGDGPDEGDEMLWFGGLLGVFDALELSPDDNDEELQTVFTIVKLVALLNDQAIFEALLCDMYFTRVAGALEHDPDLPFQPRHREYLRTEVTHKQVVPITDAEILAKVHQNFRIMFLRDVLLPRVLDEHAFATLQSMDGYNAVDIANALHADTAFMKNVFATLRSRETSQQKREDVAAFLQELCTVAKKLQVPGRNAFYRSLMDKSDQKYFEILQLILADARSTSRERLIICDLLMLSLQHDSSLLRNFVMNQSQHPELPSVVQEKEQRRIGLGGKSPLVLTANPNSNSETGGLDPIGRNSLLFQLIRRLVSDQEAGTQAQAAEVFRFLLDPETMEVHEKDKFLSVFYEHYVQWLVAPLGDDRADTDSNSILAILNRCRSTSTFSVQSAVTPSSNQPLQLSLSSPASDVLQLAEVGGMGSSNSNHSFASSASVLESPRNIHADAEREYSLTFVGSSRNNNALSKSIHTGGEGARDNGLAVSPSSASIGGGVGSVVASVILARNRAFGAVSAATARVAEHHICELLSFCVQTHGYRIKYYMLRNGVVHSVLGLLERREKHLVLDAIRFMRTCVGIKDEFYNRFFVRNNLFKGIFAVFVRNGPRNNLLNSAIIELLEFIRSENVKILVSYVVNNFSEVFEEVSYVETYRQLLATHQNNERIRVQQGGGAGNATAEAVPSASATAGSVTDGGSSDGGTGNLSDSNSAGPRRATNRTSRSVFGERRAMADDDDDSYFNDSSDDDEQSKQGDVTNMSFEEHVRMRAAEDAKVDVESNASIDFLDMSANGDGGARRRSHAVSLSPARRKVRQDAAGDEDENDDDDLDSLSFEPKHNGTPAAVANLVDVPLAVRSYAQAPAAGRPPTPALPPRTIPAEGGGSSSVNSDVLSLNEVDPPPVMSLLDVKGAEVDSVNGGVVCLTPLRPKRQDAPTSSDDGEGSDRTRDAKRTKQNDGAEPINGDVAMT